MSEHYSAELRAAVADYYDVEAAEHFLDSPVHEGCQRWRCTLCGWPIDLGPEAAAIAPACGCGGCGMTCLRPIEEFGVKNSEVFLVADFCLQCNRDFGLDYSDFSHLSQDRLPLEPGYGYPALCEGCGPTLVNDAGECISSDCLRRHGLRGSE